MAVPSVVKFKKDCVEYTSKVDRTKYLLSELIRAALKDTGRYVCRMTRKQIRKRTGRLSKNTQYWVRRKSQDLQVGFKPGGWYGMYQELGTEKKPKIGALKNAVMLNLDEIRRIQGQYLSVIEDENRAMNLIDEAEEQGQ